MSESDSANMNEQTDNRDLPMAHGPPASRTPDTQSPIVELFCWGMILAICGLTFASQWMVQNSESEKSDRPAIEMTEVRSVEFSTRLLIAQKNLTGDATRPDISGLNQGPLWQRYAAAIQVSEISGPADALSFLEDVDAAVQAAAYEPDERQLAVRRALENVFDSLELGRPGEVSLISADDEALLKKEFGWLGKVALNPASNKQPADRPGIDDRANRMILVMVGIAVAALLFFLAASVCLPMGIVQFFRGRFQSRLPDQTVSGSIYLEMFTCWLVVTVVAMPMIILSLGIEVREDNLILALAAQILPLVTAMLWPVFRGKPLADMLGELGLSCKNPFAEIGSGIFGYLCAVIPLAVLLAIIGLVMHFGGMTDNSGLDSPPAIHPVQNMLMSGDVTQIFFVLLAACVFAPIVEEIVFRGALYRYLRDRTGNYSRWPSIIASVLIGGILFAAIHPQNLFGLIPLTTLAIYMTMLRQWRSSLLASMTFHAINNSVVMTSMMMIYL